MWDGTFDTKRTDLSIGYECVRDGGEPGCVVTLIKISSFVTIWAGLLWGHRLQGESRVNLWLPFTSLFSPFHHLHLPGVKTHNAALCVSSRLRMFVSWVFFFLFSCLSAVNKAPVLLYCSQRVRESVKAEALACRFQREIERVTFHTWQRRLKACWWRKYKHTSSGAVREGAVICLFWIECPGLDVGKNETHFIKIRS